MANEEIKRMFKLRDRVFRAISKDKTIRIAAIKNTKTAQDAQAKHNLDFVSASLLARALAGAVLTSSFLKGEERIILQFQGDGAISEIYAEAMNIGEARGYVHHSREIDTENISSMRDAVGVGLLTLTKILYDKNEPVVGIVPITKGDISSDLVYYFTQSEQIPTAIILDVSLTDNGLIEHSGGIIIQALPGADEEMLKKLEEILLNNQNLCDRFREDKMPDEILMDILPFDFDIISTSLTDFFCRCTKDLFKKRLLTLGVSNLKDVREKGQNEIVCRFCNSHYTIEDIDFEELILTSQASVN